ncbi:MAG: hypothetical protein QXE06_07565, partial [Candidatus Bathyarchaeia archaeon]
VATDCEGSYKFQWDTRTFKNGLHTITVKAYDLAGKTSTRKLCCTFLTEEAEALLFMLVA